MWLMSYSQNEIGQLELLLCKNEENSNIDGKIIITKNWIKINTNKGKNSVLKSRLDYFRIQFQENFAEVSIQLSADENWNKMMREKHPLRWRLGLITKYNKCNLKIFSSSKVKMLNEIVNSLKVFGYNVKLLPVGRR